MTTIPNFRRSLVALSVQTHTEGCLRRKSLQPWKCQRATTEVYDHLQKNPLPQNAPAERARALLPTSVRGIHLQPTNQLNSCFAAKLVTPHNYRPAVETIQRPAARSITVSVDQAQILGTPMTSSQRACPSNTTRLRFAPSRCALASCTTLAEGPL